MRSKRAFDPELTARQSNNLIDPLLRKQNEIYEKKLGVREYLSRSNLICLTFLIVVTVIVVVIVVVLKLPLDNKKSNSVECYVYPSCTAEIAYDPVTGFTNDTGWLSQVDGSCCDICLPGTDSKVCFGDCPGKQGIAGDWDYLVFAQMWLPQFCNALLDGRDPTLSHLSGSRCTMSGTTNSSEQSTYETLTIHGLWPDYTNGYPQCCNDTYFLGTQSVNNVPTPLDPSELKSWNIYPELNKYWFDPTSPPGEKYSEGCSYCYILNHEWMKHGTCFLSSNDGIDLNLVSLEEEYFTAGLQVNSIVMNATSLVSSFVGNTVNITSIEELYGNAINVMCDPDDIGPDDDGSGIPSGVLLEIRTCWTMDMSQWMNKNERHAVGSIALSLFDFTQIDCPPAVANSFSQPCPEKVYIPSFTYHSLHNDMR